MPSLLKGIITRQRLNYLVLLPVVWRVSFMIEHEFCMAADISKILAMGDLASWAQTRRADLLFHPSAEGPRLTRRAFKSVASVAISLFIKTECFTSPRSLELLFCCWARLMIRLTWNPSVKGGQIHYLGRTQRHFVWLHLRPNLLGSPTACSHTCKQPALRVFVDESQRRLFMCRTNKLVFKDVTETEFRVSTL